MRKILLTLGVATTMLAGLLAIYSPTASAYDLTSQACKGQGTQSAYCQAGPVSPTNLLTKITRVIMYIVGIASVLTIIVGGILMSASNGDPSKVSTARTMILYSLVGLVVTAFAALITVFVLDKLK